MAIKRSRVHMKSPERQGLATEEAFLFVDSKPINLQLHATYALGHEVLCTSRTPLNP